MLCPAGDSPQVENVAAREVASESTLPPENEEGESGGRKRGAKTGMGTVFVAGRDR
mgnify:CR=1 FL=1